MANTKRMSKKTTFTKVGQVLKGKQGNPRFAKALARHKALSSCDLVINDLLKQSKGQVKALDLKGGVLVVACLSREMAYQIKLYANRIIQSINQLLGKTVIYALQLEV